MNLLRRLWPSRQGPSFPAVQVDSSCFVIGDVHGCLSQLQLLLDAAPADVNLICVGDYIDRGEDSAGVLRFLAERPDITCLMGNHEAMLLKFVEDPTGRAARWLRYGGLQTLASFGVTGGIETKDAALLTRLRDDLVAAMGDDMLDWIARLPVLEERGNVSILHAGADPAVPIVDQGTDTLIWGHPAFGKTPRTDGQWVLHGHTIVDQPCAANGIISVDTGAYATGRLTAAHLTADGCSFVQVDGGRIV